MDNYTKYYHRIAIIDNDADEIIMIKHNNNPNVKKAYIFNLTEEDNNKFPQLIVGEQLIIYIDSNNQVLYSEINKRK